MRPSATVPTVLRPLDTTAAQHYTPIVEDASRRSELLLLRALLDEPGCVRLNKAAEAVGYGRTSCAQRYRGNLRLIIGDRKLARGLWERVRPLCPRQRSGRQYCLGGRWLG